MTTGRFTNLQPYTPFLYRLVFVLSCIPAWQLFHHYFVSDAIAQLAIAEHIRNGEWGFAANGYWSPLTSWLLAPLTAIIPLDGMDVFRIMNLALAGISLHFSVQITRKLVTEKTIADVLSCGVSAILPFWALYYLTSDLLFLTILLWSLGLHVSDRFYKNHLSIGICGILLYLSKAYGLFFFIAHSVLMLLFSQKADLRKNVMALAKGMLIFIPVCALWILTISSRYGHFTISESGRYNAAIAQHRPLVHPCDTMGLIAPLPGYRYSMWEDVTRHINVQQPATVTPKTERWKENASVLASSLNKTPRYGTWLFIGSLIIVWLLTRQVLKKILLPLATAIIFSGGYLLLFVEERYLLFPALILFFAVVMMIAQLIVPVKQKWLKLVICLIPLYILLRPALDIYAHTDVSEEEAVHDIAVYLKSNNHTEKNIAYASWSAYQCAPLAWEMKWKDMGGLAGYGNDSMRMMNDVTRYDVRYFIAPAKQSLPVNLINGFQQLYTDKKGIFILYQRK